MAARRLKKVLEMRTDSPEMLDSLDTLSSFFDPTDNTPETRKLLRNKIENRGLELAKQFVAEFDPVQEYINQVGASVEQLHNRCDQLLSQLHKSKSDTEVFLEQVNQLRGQRDEIQTRALAIDELLERFQLSKEHSEALERGPSNDPEQGVLFFKALKHVVVIRSECQALMRSQYQAASMDIFETMSKLQESANDQLFHWVQEESQSFESVNPDPSDTYLRAFQVLKSVPAYFFVVEETLAAARKDALTSRFITALSQGNPAENSRPIDMHAHDPVRYLGDMLAWVHQAFLSEIDFLKSLYEQRDFSDTGMTEKISASTNPESPSTNGNAETAILDETIDGNQTIPIVRRELVLASSIFSGISGVLLSKLQQMLCSSHSLLTLYKLYNLTCFYHEAMAPIASFKAKKGVIENSTKDEIEEGDMVLNTVEFEETIAKMKAFTIHVLFSATKSLTNKLLSSPPSYPADLSSAVEIMDLVRRLTDILAVQKDSMVQDESVIADDTDALLNVFLNPIIQICQKSETGLDASSTAIYVINNLVAVQVSISRFEHTASWVQKLAVLISDHMDVLVLQHVDAVLVQSGFKSKLDALRQRKEVELPLSQLPGMEPATLKAVVERFYESLYSLTMPQFNKISSPRLRGQARRSTCLLISQAYDELYAVVSDPKEGYGDISQILVHAPEAVKGLLSP